MSTREAEAVQRFDGRAFASPVRLLVVGASEPDARSAWRAVLDELAAVDAALSRFRDDSDVTRLCRDAGARSRPVPVGRRLRIALVLAERARRVTGGRFDPRVLVDLERLGDPGASVGEAALATDHGHPPAGPAVVAHRGGITIRAPVDLGGIGKGLAARWAAARAVRHLPVGAGVLIDLGGDIGTAGRAVTDGWRVGIEDPFDAPDRPLAVIGVHGGAIATSSVRNRRWRTSDGRAVHHLIDPRTGEPGGAGLTAVTVAHRDPAWAEVWSKTLFLAGAEAIRDEARSRDLPAWWVDEDGGLSMTPRARQASVWIDEARVA